MPPHDKPRILAVGSALPRRRISAAALARELGLAPDRLHTELGLLAKAVATDDDEHPVDFSVRAARAALQALGASAADVGLVIFTGVSREYLPSWSVAIEIIGQLQATRALGYDLNLGCAAALVAIELATQRQDNRPPLSLIIAAERWSHTLSAAVPFPLALAAHADGGAACLVGPGAGIDIGPLHSAVWPQYNDFVQIKAGGTRHPASAETVRSGQHFRTASPTPHDDVLGHYIKGYTHVIGQACVDLATPPAQLGCLIINQVRSRIRAGVRAALGITAPRMIDTYPQLGHLGGADLFFGLQHAQRSGQLAGQSGVLASSTLSAFVAGSFRCDPTGIATTPHEGETWT